MSKKTPSLSSVDLAALVEEIQFLVKGKLSRLYQVNDIFLLQIHAPGKGNRLLRIVPGKLLCLTSRKETQLKPSAFSMQLRKYIDNASIVSVEQPASERIVVFSLQKAQRYHLIAELFSPGNLVLTDAKHIILAAWQKQAWKSREIKAGVPYCFPPAGADWKVLAQEEFIRILRSSGKRNIVVSLATELGIGGIYGEELCARSGIPKETPPGKLHSGQLDVLYAALEELRASLNAPQGYDYGEIIAPFSLRDRVPVRITHSFGELVDEHFPWTKESPYEQKIQALKRMVAGQEEALRQLGIKAEELQRKGELIYENYTMLQELFREYREVKEKNGTAAALNAMRQHERVKNVDASRKMAEVPV